MDIDFNEENSTLIQECLTFNKNQTGKKQYKPYKFAMEKKLGRRLLPKETVHHIDKNKKNNNPNNLELYPDGSIHHYHHNDPKKAKAIIELVDALDEKYKMRNSFRAMDKFKYL